MLTGVVGVIRWHYYTAAQVEGYTVTRSKDGRRWSLTATVVLADQFKMSQRPLTFSAKHAKGEWRFPILNLERRDHMLTAQLGPPEP